MEVIREIHELKARQAVWNSPVGLVPTMGYLHEGHMALVRRARQETATVVVTIFVNPTQFGPSEDFERYPRAFGRDLDLLRSAGVDIVFAPPVSEMYPDPFSTWVEVEELGELFEGVSRPGHFRGVATVCNKLFNLVSADRAYFGQKDAQQVAIITKMVCDLNMKPDIVAITTVREPDGLAMSSRNAYLNPQQRAAAAVLFRALNTACQLYRDGCRDVAMVTRAIADIVHEEHLAELDYAAVVDPTSFEELDTLERPALAILAVRIGTTRLIDNMLLKE